MITMMDFLSWFYKLAGSMFCHQLPERTIAVDGVLLPVCARDTGIYAGIFICAVFLFVKGRFTADKPPALRPALVLCGLMSFMIFDGVTSYLGIRATNNETRIFSGMLFGIGLVFFLIPLANFKIYGENTKEILPCAADIVVPITAGLIFCIAVLKSLILPWWLVSTMVFTGFIFIVSRVAFTVTVRLGPRGFAAQRIVAVAATSIFLTMLYLVSHYLLQPLKYILLER